MGFGGVSQSRLTIAKVKKKKNATRCLFKEAARGIFLLFYFQLAIRLENTVVVSGVQTRAYCLISSMVDLRGFFVTVLLISECNDELVESFLIGITFTP